ncbi:MAG: SPOR domain-containing protein [Bacteroides sp.]|nr:SPOR domain-containing protein [Bacteroides sp.]
MKKIGLLILLSCLFCTLLSAQSNIVKSLQSDVPGQGKVTIHQDARIATLIGQGYIPDASAGEEKVIKSTGYRVQLYAGNNTRQAKNEAHEVAESVKQLFPDLSVYTTFTPPRWLCRVGDYRSYEEADAMMRQLRATGEFKEVSIVKDHINIYF